MEQFFFQSSFFFGENCDGIEGSILANYQNITKKIQKKQIISNQSEFFRGEINLCFVISIRVILEIWIQIWFFIFFYIT
jgi:hypothetical protein